MSDPWRYRCPEGHTSIVRRAHGGYRCQSCDAEYDADPVDAKSGRGDSDAEPVTPIPTMTAASRLWDATGDTPKTIHARDISPVPVAMAAALKRAAERGLAERVETSTSRADRWRATEKAAFLGADAGSGVEA